MLDPRNKTQLAGFFSIALCTNIANKKVTRGAYYINQLVCRVLVDKKLVQRYLK